MPLTDPPGDGARRPRCPRGADDDGARDRVIGDLLDELAALRSGAWATAFRGWLRDSLSLVHVQVLAVLEESGPLTMGRLADALDVSVASATGIVDRMERRGLVERRRDDVDRRRVAVLRTAAGAEILHDLGSVRRDGLDRLLHGMTDGELRALRTGLRGLRRARTSMPPDPGSTP